MEFKDALEKFKGMYFSLIRKYYSSASKEDIDDLIQKGQIAIWEALKSFDPDKGASLSTHVYQYIWYKFMNTRCENYGLTRGKYEGLKKDELLPTVGTTEGLEFLMGSEDQNKDRGLLFDYLYQLANAKQAYILDMMQDGKGLKNISENLGLTRQAVEQSLKRLKTRYEKFEPETKE